MLTGMCTRAAMAFLAILSFAEPSSAAEVPSVNPNGIVNAASYRLSVAPGSIATIFGNPFAAGISVQFDGGAPAPLFYVSGSQANVQVPWELAGKSQSTVTVTVNGQTSEPQAVDVIAFAPGIFTMNGRGAGQGAIVDGSYRLVDASNPAVPGSTAVAIYCTGLGSVTNRPVSGVAASTTSLSLTRSTPGVTIGGAQAEVLFSGLAPGSIGEYQVNALVPKASATGDAVPVTISIGGYTSNIATIAVRPRAVEMTSDERATALVAQMTQDEKIQLLHGAGTAADYMSQTFPRGAASYIPGIPRLGIPDLYTADGSTGAANLGEATALPSSIASAAGWDVNEAYKYGRVIGSELRAYGININLGGNINLIGREPRDGRTFETKGEDPILAGRIAAAHIRGTQDQHVIGGIKHFAFNDQETGRDLANAIVDERGARESDLLAFEIGIKESNVQSVMCAYNQVNGFYSCENAHLLNDVLKGDWGFQGFVMSDWWATHSVTPAALAGLDQEQPNNKWFGGLKAAVQNGKAPQSRLDDMTRRVLRAMFEVGLFDYPDMLQPVDSATDQAVAQEAEEQGAVLLKNAGGLLPLEASGVKSIALIGSHADVGVLSGGGSAQVIPVGGPALVEGKPCPPCWSPVIWDPSSPLKAIQAMAPQAAIAFDDGTDSARAAALASTSDVAIVFLSQWTSEGMDLENLNFTDLIHSTPVNQDALVSAVASKNARTIVVLENGGPQVMPWLNGVQAVLEAWYPGQRGGEAIANILFGVVNPSGKLPVTFPASVMDLPRPILSMPDVSGNPFPVNYSEGMQVGYKWYESKNLAPLFPFGFGLSYTTFSLSNASISGLATGFQLTFDLQNTGAAAGAEVPQVYVAMNAVAGEPPIRLVGWQKVFLDPGALQHVTIAVDENDSSHPLSYWDTVLNAWRIAPGDYPIYLGTSSKDLALVGSFHAGD